jgi:predicted N-formylglutamate amidohydrolase
MADADADEPIERIAGPLDSGVLVICDHASNAVPAAFDGLGLPAAAFARHIAYDIGAAWLTRHLAALLDAPALLTTFSRLLIDPNRGADDPTLVMRLSDGEIVPGNARIDAEGICARRRRFWQPYRGAIDATLEAMLAAGPVPVVLSIHSFTPAWKGVPRPWEVGILWDSDPRFAVPLIAALGEICAVGDNEPYDGALAGDTLDEAVTRRGLPGLLIEVRQDLIATQEAAEAWADRLAGVLRPLLADPALHASAFVPSRTGRHGAA